MHIPLHRRLHHDSRAEVGHLAQLQQQGAETRAVGVEAQMLALPRLTSEAGLIHLLPPGRAHPRIQPKPLAGGLLQAIVVQDQRAASCTPRPQYAGWLVTMLPLALPW